MVRWLPSIIALVAQHAHDLVRAEFVCRMLADVRPMVAEWRTPTGCRLIRSTPGRADTRGITGERADGSPASGVASGRVVTRSIPMYE
jgi:hypothetical protein